MRFIKGDSLKVAIEHFHADEALQKDPGRQVAGNSNRPQLAVWPAVVRASGIHRLDDVPVKAGLLRASPGVLLTPARHGD
jgi:hypothetical protein